MVLLFLHDLSVPFTNRNRFSEQGHAKAPGEGFGVLSEPEKGLENYCILRTVTETPKTRTGSFGNLKFASAFMKLLTCLIAPTSCLDLLYLNVPGKKYQERNWTVANLSQNQSKRGPKTSVAIPAGLYRTNQINFRCEAA